MNNKIFIVILTGIVIILSLFFLMEQNHQNISYNKTTQTKIKKNITNKTKQNVTNTTQTTNNVVIYVDKYQKVLPLPIKPIKLDDLPNITLNKTVPSPIKPIKLSDSI